MCITCLNKYLVLLQATNTERLFNWPNFPQRNCWFMKFPDFRGYFVYYQLFFSFLVLKTWERGNRSKYAMKIGLDHTFPYSRWAFAPLTQHCWSLSRSSSLKAVRLGRPLSWRLFIGFRALHDHSSTHKPLRTINFEQVDIGKQMVVEDEILEDVTIDELRESLSEHEPRWRSIS